MSGQRGTEFGIPCKKYEKFEKETGLKMSPNMGFDTEQVKIRVAQVLQTVGLEEMAEKAPHHLSAGQKRAAAVATILSMSPQIITLDEPDGSLDPRNR